jgi:phosphoribosylanthranilate isomerase
MTQIKICGITNLSDALCASEAGADAVGFIFHPASPRYLSPEKAEEIIKHLPSGIARIGVFVNSEADEVNRTADICGLDFIQLHGDESPEYCRLFPSRSLIKAVFLKTEEDISTLDGYNVRAFLADARSTGMYGGTGKQADWELAAKVAERYPLILAGGLNEGNIIDALKAVSPDAVDINSGIEASPGIKDHKRLQRIILMVKNAGLRLSGASETLDGIFNAKIQ